MGERLIAMTLGAERDTVAFTRPVHLVIRDPWEEVRIMVPFVTVRCYVPGFRESG